MKRKREVKNNYYFIAKILAYLCGIYKIWTFSVDLHTRKERSSIVKKAKCRGR